MFKMTGVSSRLHVCCQGDVFFVKVTTGHGWYYTILVVQHDMVVGQCECDTSVVNMTYVLSR